MLESPNVDVCQTGPNLEDVTPEVNETGLDAQGVTTSESHESVGEVREVAWDQTSIELVRSHLSSNGSSYFPGMGTVTDVQLDSDPQALRQVVRFVVSDGSHKESVIAKRALKPASTETFSEFQNYTRFHSIFGQEEGFRCPVPLTYIPDCGVLLTKDEPGIQLLQFLSPKGHRSIRQVSSIGCAVKRVANFLRAFHSSGPSQVIGLGTVWLQTFDAREPLWSGFLESDLFEAQVGWRLAAATRKVRDDTYRLRSALTSPMGPFHGDLAADNILVASDAVTVLDAGELSVGPQLRDVAFFTVNLALSAGLRLRSRRWSRSVVDAFLGEYFGSEKLNDNDVILVGLFGLSVAAGWIEQHRLSRVPLPMRRLARLHAKWLSNAVLEDIVNTMLPSLKRLESRATIGKDPEPNVQGLSPSHDMANRSS